MPSELRLSCLDVEGETKRSPIWKGTTAVIGCFHLLVPRHVLSVQEVHQMYGKIIFPSFGFFSTTQVGMA